MKDQSMYDMFTQSYIPQPTDLDPSDAVAVVKQKHEVIDRILDELQDTVGITGGNPFTQACGLYAVLRTVKAEVGIISRLFPNLFYHYDKAITEKGMLQSSLDKTQAAKDKKIVDLIEDCSRKDQTIAELKKKVVELMSVGDEQENTQGQILDTLKAQLEEKDRMVSAMQSTLGAIPVMVSDNPEDTQNGIQEAQLKILRELVSVLAKSISKVQEEHHIIQPFFDVWKTYGPFIEACVNDGPFQVNMGDSLKLRDKCIQQLEEDVAFSSERVTALQKELDWMNMVSKAKDEELESLRKACDPTVVEQAKRVKPLEEMVEKLLKDAGIQTEKMKNIEQAYDTQVGENRNQGQTIVDLAGKLKKRDQQIKTLEGQLETTSRVNRFQAEEIESIRQAYTTQVSENKNQVTMIESLHTRIEKLGGVINRIRIEEEDIINKDKIINGQNEELSQLKKTIDELSHKKSGDEKDKEIEYLTQRVAELEDIISGDCSECGEQKLQERVQRQCRVIDEQTEANQRLMEENKRLGKELETMKEKWGKTKKEYKDYRKSVEEDSKEILG